MSNRKRKQKPPERFSEEKRAKMTWSMYDMATCIGDESSTTSSFSSASPESCDEAESIRTGLNSAKRKKQAGHRRNLELNLENNYPQHCICQLGVFGISLCTSKMQEDEVRINGANNGLNLPSVSLTDEQQKDEEHSCVIIKLSFDSQCSTTSSENINFGDVNNINHELDSLRQVSFRAVVPSVSKEKLEALVYLQNKGVVSLVLKPEQHILKDCWEVVVCLNESGLTKLPFASIDSRNRQIDKMMKILMAWFYKFSFETDVPSQDCDVPAVDKGFDELYDAIKATREKASSADSAIQKTSKLPHSSTLNEPVLSHTCNSHDKPQCNNSCNKEPDRPNGLIISDVQHPDLKPTLRGYQRKAVKWILRREQGCQLSSHDDQLSAESDGIHPLWKEVHTLDGKLIYFNPYTGRLTRERFPLPLLPLGGILADEMGLGKTVEVIACILCHPKPSSKPKLLNDTETFSQTSSINQTSKANPLFTTNDRVIKSAQCQICSKEEEHSSTFKADHKSPYGSEVAHLCSRVDQANTGDTLTEDVQGCSGSNPAECEVCTQEGANSHTVKPDQKPLEDKRTEFMSLSDDQINIEKAPAHNVEGCYDSKPAEYEIYSKEGSNHSTIIIKPDHNCGENLHDLRDINHGQVTTSLKTVHTSVHCDSSCGDAETVTGDAVHKEINCDTTKPNHDCSKNGCDSGDVSCHQSQIYSFNSTCKLDGDSSCENVETVNGERDGSEFLHSKSSCSSQESISPVAVSSTLHNSSSCVSLESGQVCSMNSCTDQSTELDSAQGAPEVPSSPNSSSTSVEQTATVKCQCICGNTAGSYEEALLQCCGCQVVFHAECLQYDCPQEFLCPQCALKQPAVSSRATLIISPAPIAQQWVDEISRHTKPSSLKLLVYEGVAKSGFILPEVLADHDVILTTYSTLRSDFYHLGPKQGNSAGRSMRYDKRYMALPSPLTGVVFWRICLDEAQMVESTTAKAAEVALHLNGVHRWCVTGTPIQKGLSDIYGLLLFLGVDPYCHQKWWKALLYEPYKNGQRQPLCDVLAKIMWRSAKKDVIHEIQLPDQEEKVKWLTFSPVEQHFYRRQHEECAGTAMKMLSHWEKTDTMLSTIDRHTVHQLLNPLLRLRQACCHPQAVRGGYLSMQKSTLTMDKLLESLISKAKLECEEAHRQLLFAFNGLAGIHILKDEWPEAVDMYREAIRSWTEHETTFRTDALQKLHTLFNLSDVLSHHQEGCSRTLRDDKLQDEVKELKNNYTTRVNAQVTAAQENLDVAKTSIAEIRQKIDFQSPWWMEAFHYTTARRLEGDLCQRIKDELSSTDMDLGSIGRFTDLRGLQYLVSSKLDLIESTHNNLLVALDKLAVPPSRQMVQASAECCLRPAKDSHAKRCVFCEVDDIFTEYESRIFGHQGMKGVYDQDLQPDESIDWHRHGNTGGLRAESEVEKVLRVVHNFIKTNKIAPDTQQEGRHHLSLIEGLRKEFKFLRALWFALHERVSCLDELDMCTTRLRLQLPGEPDTDNIHVIHPLQVEQQRLKFMSDRVVAQTELRKKLGQLLYLNNLAKTQTCHDGKNPDPCPVCVKQLGVQWSVFSCGHCICCQCAWVLLRQAGVGPRHRNVHVKCPMCRVPTIAQEISYVSTSRTQTEEVEENISVKGSHSTKVEAIVRTLLTIKLADGAAKCLVFSTATNFAPLSLCFMLQTMGDVRSHGLPVAQLMFYQAYQWQDVLAVIAKALDENGIKYRHITGSRHFQTNLQTFKQDTVVGVLLLPLQTGSNGLNIIQATHVLLVEPALNPAHELQAVGRVHRIGQTKPTHVYRFIIRGTVESRMYSLLQSKPSGCVRTGARDSENSSLTLGDLASLFTQDDDQEDEQCMTGTFGFQDECEHQA